MAKGVIYKGANGVEGLFPSLHLMIVPTNMGWSGYNTWGQLAVDCIEIYDR